MKKIILFRVIAIAFFCFGTLAIKSETSVCNAKEACMSKNRVSAMPLDPGEQRAMPTYPYEEFFIKI